MGHHHSHHHHVPADMGGAFRIGVGLNLAYVLLEAGVGQYVGSMALVADAVHNLSDVATMLLAWGAVALGKRPPSDRFTYGMKSATILASFVNAVLLALVVVAIAWEAIRRLRHPEPIPAELVAVVAGAGVLVNLATTLLFVRGAAHDLNIRGVFLHMAADTAMSVAVVGGGLAMMWGKWYWVDPLLSLAIAIAIFWAGWDLLRESVVLILHGRPDGLDTAAVREFLSARPGIVDVPRLRLWALSTTENALAAELLRPETDTAAAERFLHETVAALRKEFRLTEVTLQISAAPCPAAPPADLDHDHDHDGGGCEPRSAAACRHDHDHG